MTKDVLLKISGMHEEVDSDSNEAAELEVITRASYYMKKTKHYIFYDEPVEGSASVIKNKILYQEGGALEIVKSGATNSHLTFEDGKINVSDYSTPYGQLVVGTYTKHLVFDETDDVIKIEVAYELDINGAKMADSEIYITITSVK